MKNKKTLILPILALVMAVGVSLGSSLAYFTTYVTAEGTQALTLGWQTEMKEEYKDGRKEVLITNTGELDCYVRARAYAGELIDLSYSGDNWINGGDGFWYYNAVVPAGGSAEKLFISIDHNKIKELKEKYNMDAMDYDVIVVQECAPVSYNDDGKPILPPPTDDATWGPAFEE